MEHFPSTPDIPWAVQSPTTGPTQMIKPKYTEPYYTKEALPHLINPKCTEPYYTKPVKPIKK